MPKKEISTMDSYLRSQIYELICSNLKMDFLDGELVQNGNEFVYGENTYTIYNRWTKKLDDVSSGEIPGSDLLEFIYNQKERTHYLVKSNLSKKRKEIIDNIINA